MKLAILGAGGRMGRAVARFAHADGITIVGAADAAASPWVGRDVGDAAGIGTLGVAIATDLGAALLGADVLIDFSVPAAFPDMLRRATHAGVAVVSGTTGLDQACLDALDRASQRIAVLWAPNMSIAVHVLGELVAAAVRSLGDGYDVEIVETHHAAKADAPSGTARQLAEAVRAARSELEPTHGRVGQLGPRRPSELGIHAVRGGGVVGDHAVHLLGPLDRLEITHRAATRDLFAAGALRAARFVVGQPPGRYSLRDVVADGAAGTAASGC